MTQQQADWMASAAAENNWMASAAAEAMDRFERIFRPQLKRRRWDLFAGRLNDEMETLFRLTHQLYGWRFDFAWTLELLVGAAVAGYADRPRWLDKNLTNDVEPELWVAVESNPTEEPDDLSSHLPMLGATHLHFRTSVPGKPQCRTLVDGGLRLAVSCDLDRVPQSHPWVEDATRGDRAKASYFITFGDRSGPDAYGTQMRDLGGRIDGDAFSWHPELDGGRWVWTTHGPMFWDLDYRNPELLASMVSRLLELTNLGVTRICLRGLPFLWKQAGTSSINLPEAHVIVQILAGLVRVAAPGASLVADHDASAFPSPLPPYERFIAREECPIGYEPRLTSLIWDAMAKRDTHLLGSGIAARYPAGCLRLASLRLQTGPTPSELSGLNHALEEDQHVSADLAGRRLLAAFAILVAATDVPEIDLGDEMGLPLRFLNDSYDPGPDEGRLGPHGLLWSGLVRLGDARRASYALGRSETARVLDVGDTRVLGLTRGGLVVLINTCPEEVEINVEALPIGHDLDLLTGDNWIDRTLPPYGFRYLVESSSVNR